jgi:hypothetical protein
MGRKIKIFSTLQTGITEKEVNANTWGELKTELAAASIMTGDMKCMVKETQTSFEADSAPLPQNLGHDTNGNQTHDFTLFLSPTKTKSGK